MNRNLQKPTPRNQENIGQWVCSRLANVAYFVHKFPVQFWIWPVDDSINKVLEVYLFYMVFDLVQLLLEDLQGKRKWCWRVLVVWSSETSNLRVSILLSGLFCPPKFLFHFTILYIICWYINLAACRGVSGGPADAGASEGEDAPSGGAATVAIEEPT